MKDFSHLTYRELLIACEKASYRILSLGDFVKEEQQLDNYDQIIILRHDIDRKPQRALKMAIIENEFNIRSSYYINSRNAAQHSNCVKKIVKLGHEIGYHYSDLTDCKGNLQQAFVNFRKNLSALRQFYNIKTISMDGKPLSRYNNLDMWNEFDYKKVGIAKEFYLDIDYSLFAYYTDTGRSLNNEAFNIKDRPISKQVWPKYKSTFEIIDAIKSGTFPPKVVINIHPEHWTNNTISWYTKLIWQSFKNIFKIFLKKL
jgi:hypothetical protein